MAGASLTFEFDDLESERRFVAAYLAPAWERFEAAKWFETGWFWRYGQFSTYDVGFDESVEVVFEGDPDALLESERSRWTELQETERLESWSLERYEPKFESLLEQQRDAKGEVGGTLDYRLKPLTTRFALDVARTFDDRVPPVGTESGENPKAIGFWVVIHYAMMQNGYDWYHEIDAANKAIRNRCRSMAHYRDADVALAELWDVIDDLEALADDIERERSESSA